MMKLPPRDFWALSLTEWRALCTARFPGAGAGMNRAGLERLLKEHPDG
jgi:hypothetical protein